MGNPFSPTSVSSYNSNPPPDDGSQVASNLVSWSTIKTKLPDPIKTAFDASETATNNAFAKIIGGAGFTTTAVDYTVLVADQGRFVKCTASGKVITTPDATSVGSPFVFLVVNESTGNITLTGNNPGVQQTVDGSTSVTIPAGAGCILNTDGTNWFTGGQNFTNTQIAPVPGNYKNKVIKVASNTTVTVTADFVVLTNGSGKFQTNAVSSTVNMGTTGVDALDTGTIAIDKEYHLWAISQLNGTTKVIASLQSTANATFLANLAAIASGVYTYYARLGAVMTIHGSATLYGTWQIGDDAQYVVGLAQTATLPVISNTGTTLGTYSTTSPTLSALVVSGNGKVVPSTASSIVVTGQVNYKAGTAASMLVAPSSAYSGTNNGPQGSVGIGTPPIWLVNTISLMAKVSMLLESNSIYAAYDNAGGAILCNGWRDPP